jgi:hypothetical protein
VKLAEKNTLKLMIDSAIQIRQNFEELDAKKKHNSYWTPKGKEQVAPWNPQPKADNAMDVDSSRTKGRPNHKERIPSSVTTVVKKVTSPRTARLHQGVFR